MNSCALSIVRILMFCHPYELIRFHNLTNSSTLSFCEFTYYFKTKNSQTVKGIGHNVFVSTNYNPMLGPFTDTWDNLMSDNGSPLHFGEVHYHNSHSSTFRERVKP